MGRDIAGGKDRDGRLSGLAGTSCRRWRRGEASLSSSSFFFSFPPFALRRVEVLPALLFPILSVSMACIGYRFGSAASFHFPDNVGMSGMSDLGLAAAAAGQIMIDLDLICNNCILMNSLTLNQSSARSSL